MQLSRIQSRIVESLFDTLHIENDIDTYEYSLAGKFSGIFRAGSTYNGTEHVIFSIPTYSNSVFIGETSNRDPKEIARILSNLEDYERENSLDLELGAVVRLPNVSPDGLSFAVILLRTATSPVCSDIPDHICIDGTKVRFFLVVPVTSEEYVQWRQNGHDALMDLFESNAKDISF